MASTSEAAEDGDGGELDRLNEEAEEVSDNCGNNEEDHKSRQNEMAAASASSAGGTNNNDRSDPQADGGAVDVSDEKNDTSATVEDDAVVNKLHSRQSTTAETDDKGSIAPSADRQESADNADTPAEQQRQHSTPREKLVLEKYTLYKTESRVYIVGSDQGSKRYRILKIDRHYSPSDAVHELNITEDEMVYSHAECQQVLAMIGDGNKTFGGLQAVVSNFYGIVGFVRFTAGWYAILIKQRAAVGLVGGHYIYHCEESLIVPISSNAKPEKPSEETRLYNAFQQVDLSKNFYFSYSYDLTNTLQTNLTRPPGRLGHLPRDSPSDKRHWVADHAFHEPSQPDSIFQEADVKSAWGFNDRFMWNHFLLHPAFFAKIKERKDANCWILPLVHGFVDQAKVSIFGRTVYVTIIARRSRYFAGARFLKRGVNDEGNVANDVETEQIVHEALTTSFFGAPLGSPHGRHILPRYTSYVQHRGSIPLSWQQDTSTSSLKPPIHLHLVDPYHSAAALHFDDLFCRYGTPIIVLNLIKTREHEPRESKLIKPYIECIDYLNQFLLDAKKIKLIPFDMSAAYKNRSMDVIGFLEDIAEEVLETTKFFHSGPEPVAYSMQSDSPALGETPPSYRSTPLLQNGVCRTNCIDCLDRTNAAQFVIAKAAFGHQLHALGIISNPHLGYDSDAVNLLTEMYHDHGDTIALQYGGSHLVNTMNTYRKINQWQSHSRDMIEGIKRFYANVALDQDKQNSINLFLGIDSNTDTIAGYAGGLPTGGQLAGEKGDEGDASKQMNEKEQQNNDDEEDLRQPVRRDYRQWYTPEHLEDLPNEKELTSSMEEIATEHDNYWNEYYRPRLITNFERHFAYKVNSTARYNHRLHGERVVADSNELSPFKERPLVHSHPPRLNVGVRRWMSVSNKRASRMASDPQSSKPGSIKEDEQEIDDEESLPPISTTESLVMRLLNPKVHSAEAEEYASYVDQYRNLNLSNDLQYQHSAADMGLYETAVQTTKGNPNLSSLLQVDNADEDLYEKHVRSLRGTVLRAIDV